VAGEDGRRGRARTGRRVRAALDRDPRVRPAVLEQRAHRRRVPFSAANINRAPPQPQRPTSPPFDAHRPRESAHPVQNSEPRPPRQVPPSPRSEQQCCSTNYTCGPHRCTWRSSTPTARATSILANRLRMARKRVSSTLFPSTWFTPS